MYKPKMSLDQNKDINGFAMIERATSILQEHGYQKEADEIQQRATVHGYDEYFCLKLLKEYMDV